MAELLSQEKHHPLSFMIIYSPQANGVDLIERKFIIVMSIERDRDEKSGLKKTWYVERFDVWKRLNEEFFDGGRDEKSIEWMEKQHLKFSLTGFAPFKRLIFLGPGNLRSKNNRSRKLKSKWECYPVLQLDHFNCHAIEFVETASCYLGRSFTYLKRLPECHGRFRSDLEGYLRKISVKYSLKCHRGSINAPSENAAEFVQGNNWDSS